MMRISVALLGLVGCSTEYRFEARFFREASVAALVEQDGAVLPSSDVAGGVVLVYERTFDAYEDAEGVQVPFVALLEAGGEQTDLVVVEPHQCDELCVDGVGDGFGAVVSEQVSFDVLGSGSIRERGGLGCEFEHGSIGFGP